MLEMFISRRDEKAFAILVERHGPMVLGVCRRLLGNSTDAEDAFQATFLVLVRKARSVRPRNLVGNWLHGVARKTGLKARAIRSRRALKEREAAARGTATMTPENSSDLISVLDQELQALPANYRSVLVLCELEGRTTSEAARELACPVGTICARLARGRELLGKRLVRQGVVLGGGGIAAALSQTAMAATVPPVLMASTIKAATAVAAGTVATGAISVSITALADGVVQSLLISKLTAAAVVFTATAIGLVAIGGLISHQASIANGPTDPPPTKPEQVAQQTVAASLAEPTDNAGAPVAADPPAKEASHLEGQWRVVEFGTNGKTIAPEEAPDIRDTRFTFQGESLTISGPPGISRPRQKRCAFDAASLSGNLEMTSLDGREAGQTVACLFKLDQDRLTICIPGDPADDRPGDYTTRAGDGRTIFILEPVQP